jgi:hypothetical protein
VGELTGIDWAKRLLARYIGLHPVRHRGGEVSDGLVAQAVAALRMQRSKGHEARV